MKLFDATLDLARMVMPVWRSKATAGTTSSLTDSSMTFSDNYFLNGTLWIISGDNANKVRIVETHNQNKLSFAALTKAISVNDKYAAAPATFSWHILKEAINQSLAYFLIPKYDTSLTVVAGQSVYDLPAGVSNVLRVEVACSLDEPYYYEPNYWWREIDGKLEIRSGIFLDDDGMKMRLTYADYHGEVDENDSTGGEISPRVHPMYLRYSGMVWLWRNYIQQSQADSLISKEMFNEAKMLELEGKLRGKDWAQLPSRATLLPDW